MKGLKFIAAISLALAAGPLSAGETRLEALADIAYAAEVKIQTQVLDTMLGKGKAFAFLELKAELRSDSEEHLRSGVGETRADAGDEKPQEKPGKEGVEKKAMQQARQEKKSSEKRRSFKLEPREMKLRLLCDKTVPAEKLKAVKETLAALYPGALKPEDITVVAAEFARPSGEAAASAE